MNKIIAIILLALCSTNIFADVKVSLDINFIDDMNTDTSYQIKVSCDDFVYYDESTSTWTNSTRSGIIGPGQPFHIKSFSESTAYDDTPFVKLGIGPINGRQYMWYLDEEDIVYNKPNICHITSDALSVINIKCQHG